MNTSAFVDDGIATADRDIPVAMELATLLQVISKFQRQVTSGIVDAAIPEQESLRRIEQNTKKLLDLSLAAQGIKSEAEFARWVLNRIKPREIQDQEHRQVISRSNPRKRRIDDGKKLGYGAEIQDAEIATEASHKRSSTRRLDNEQFCKRCESIDFDAIFQLSSNESNWPIIALGAITQETERVTCPVCRIFAAIREPKELPSRNRGHGYHLRGLNTLATYSKKNKKASREQLGPSVVLKVVYGKPTRKGGVAEIERYIAGGVIATVDIVGSEPKRPIAFEGRSVDPGRINYSSLRVSLDCCRAFHQESCSVGDSCRPASLKAIDCYLRTITRISEDDAYFALSYVWGAPASGTPDAAFNEYDDTLHTSGIPQVIEDAMLVVRNMGGRYLWVDRYCINQRNADEKHALISSMGSVYECARATIVAASSGSADSGLPGVSTVLRVSQPTAAVGERLFVSTLPHLAHPLRNSMWIHRGWTYQEAVLSRRCLFFTDLQVYFSCRRMNCCEAIRKPLELSSSKGSDLVETLDTLLFVPRDRMASNSDRSQGMSDIAEFSGHLETYTSRRLTYDSDSLNAFRGILARSAFCSYWGVPFVGIDTESSNTELFDIAFAKGLYWEPVRPKISAWDSPAPGYLETKGLRRQPGCPSWSWAGWSGKMYFPITRRSYRRSSTEQERQYEERTLAGKQNFSVRIWAETADRRLITLKELGDAAAGSPSFMEESPFLSIEANIVQIRLQYSERLAGFGVCSCHPNSKHEGDIRRLNPWKDMITSVVLCEQPGKDEPCYERLVTKSWDVVVFFEGIWDHHFCMLIEWCEETAYRIGTVDLPSDVLRCLPRTRRRIRLG